MTAEQVLFEREGPVAFITFNRPEARNAMTFAMYERLYELCETVDADDEIRVLVLKGAGDRAFVAGTDISQFRAFREPEDALEYERRMNRIIGRLEAVRKPTIAQIQGFAVGGGLTLAIACDLRICGPEARFGAPIARTLGNCLSMENYARLINLIGPARTLEVVYTARLVGAEEARQIGLATEVVPGGLEALEARVRDLATTIAGNAPLTLRVTKEAVRRLLAERGKLDGEDLYLTCYLSQDFREGVAAFLEKRAPRWQGR